MSGSRPGVRVMIVDDHPLLRSAVPRAIEVDGMSVVAEVATAEEALDIALQHQPDVMLVDIALPGMSGVQLVRELAPRLPSTKIIMLSTSASDRNVADSIRYGARGYLTKDLSPEALARSVRAADAGELVLPRKLAAQLIARMTWRGRPEQDEDAAPEERLTPREQDVLRLLAEGMADRDIAAALTISRRTVETHVSTILRKLGVANRAEASRRYRER